MSLTVIYNEEADICIQWQKTMTRTVEAGPGLRVCCPTALHKTDET